MAMIKTEHKFPSRQPWDTKSKAGQHFLQKPAEEKVQTPNLFDLKLEIKGKLKKMGRFDLYEQLIQEIFPTIDDTGFEELKNRFDSVLKILKFFSANAEHADLINLLGIEGNFLENIQNFIYQYEKYLLLILEHSNDEKTFKVNLLKSLDKSLKVNFAYDYEEVITVFNNLLNLYAEIEENMSSFLGKNGLSDLLQLITQNPENVEKLQNIVATVLFPGEMVESEEWTQFCIELNKLAVDEAGESMPIFSLIVSCILLFIFLAGCAVTAIQPTPTPTKTPGATTTEPAASTFTPTAEPPATETTVATATPESTATAEATSNHQITIKIDPETMDWIEKNGVPSNIGILGEENPQFEKVVKASTEILNHRFIPVDKQNPENTPNIIVEFKIDILNRCAFLVFKNINPNIVIRDTQTGYEYTPDEMIIFPMWQDVFASTKYIHDKDGNKLTVNFDYRAGHRVIAYRIERIDGVDMLIIGYEADPIKGWVALDGPEMIPLSEVPEGVLFDWETQEFIDIEVKTTVEEFNLDAIQKIVVGEMKIAVTNKTEQAVDDEGRSRHGQLPDYTTLWQEAGQIYTFNDSDFKFFITTTGEQKELSMQVQINEKTATFIWNAELGEWFYPLSTELVKFNLSANFFEFKDQDPRLNPHTIETRWFYLVSDIYFTNLENVIDNVDALGNVITNARWANSIPNLPNIPKFAEYFQKFDKLIVESPPNGEIVIDNTILSTFAALVYQNETSHTMSWSDYVNSFIIRYKEGRLTNDEMEVELDIGTWKLDRGVSMSLSPYYQEELARGIEPGLRLGDPRFKIKNGQLCLDITIGDIGSSNVGSRIFRMSLQQLLGANGITDAELLNTIESAHWGVERNADDEIVRILHPIGLVEGALNKNIRH